MREEFFIWYTSSSASSRSTCIVSLRCQVPVLFEFPQKNVRTADRQFDSVCLLQLVLNETIQLLNGHKKGNCSSTNPMSHRPKSPSHAIHVPRAWPGCSHPLSKRSARHLPPVQRHGPCFVRACGFRAPSVSPFLGANGANRFDSPNGAGERCEAKHLFSCSRESFTCTKKSLEGWLGLGEIAENWEKNVKKINKGLENLCLTLATSQEEISEPSKNCLAEFCNQLLLAASQQLLKMEIFPFTSAEREDTLPIGHKMDEKIW